MSWTTFAAAGGLVVRDGRLLLIRQRRAYGTRWELPGGYYDGNESLEQAARREVLEETRIVAEPSEFVCTLVWEREHDRRRNVLTWFAMTTSDLREPAPQVEEDIEAAAFVDPAIVADEIHPLDRAVIDRWWPAREIGFHIHADVLVRPDGTQDYRFR